MGVSARHLKKSDARWIGAALALLLLLGSMPRAIGVAIVSTSSQPAISLDLCHPVEAATTGFSITIARPALVLLEPQLNELNESLLEIPQLRAHLTDPPDTPPPKTFS